MQSDTYHREVLVKDVAHDDIGDADVLPRVTNEEEGCHSTGQQLK